MVAITAGADCTVTALGADRWRVEKTSGIDNAYTAQALSVPITGDFVLRLEDLTPGNSVLAGVGADPAADPGYLDIALAVQFYLDDLYVYELGTYVPPIRANPGVAWIVRLGDRISYRTGAELASATEIRNRADPGGALAFDCSIARLNGAIGVQFDPPGAWAPLVLRAAPTRIAPATGLAF